MKLTIKKLIALCLCLTVLFVVTGCKKASTQILNVDDIELTEEYVFLKVGQSEALLAKVYPYNANNQNIVWSTDDSSVVSIEKGILTANNAGNTKVYAISEEGGYSDYCFVEVVN